MAKRSTPLVTDKIREILLPAMSATQPAYELDLEIDGVPLLVYRELDEARRPFVCSIEDAAYTLHFYNNSKEHVGVSASIDSKVASPSDRRGGRTRSLGPPVDPADELRC